MIYYIKPQVISEEISEVISKAISEVISVVISSAVPIWGCHSVFTICDVGCHKQSRAESSPAVNIPP